MRTTLAPLLAALLTCVLATATVAQDEDGTLRALVNDIGAAIADVESELAVIDQRMPSDEWMVFESASQGLVQVDLAELGRWVPVVHLLRLDAEDAGWDASLNDMAARSPGLWQAWILLVDAPAAVLDGDLDQAVAWLRDRYAHLQTPEQRSALYEGYRAELLEKQDALRVTDEVFMFELAKQESFGGELLQVQQWCREMVRNELPMSEDGSTELGPDAPSFDALPQWCRERVAPAGAQDGVGAR